MICPNCGQESNGKFCPRCGTMMSMPESTAAETTVLSDASNPFRQTPPTAPEAPAAPQAPVQGYAPNTGYPNQPQQPTVPNRPAPQPGYAAPQAAYAAQQAAPQPGVSAQSYAGGPGYVPAQGYNPGQPANTGYANPALVDPGNSPARIAVRKIASSPLYLLAALLFTASLVFSAIPYVKQFITFFQYFDYYRNDSEALSTVIGMAIGILVVLIMALALWSIYFAAIRKNPVRMRTGGMTTIKVFLIIALIFMILGLIGLVGVTIFMAVAADSEFFDEANKAFLDFLKQYNYTFEETGSLDFKTLLIITGAAAFVVCLIATIFIGKLIKTINTVKRVIRIGHPDDRVSPFAAVLCILSAIGSIFSGVNYITQGKEMLLPGVSYLCGAICIFLFGVMIFQFRGRMRQLGVYHGVTTSQPTTR